MNWLVPVGVSVGVYGKILADEQAQKPVLSPPGNISIIMPAFNEEALIANSISSIQSQDMILAYPDHFEVIIVDNGSGDWTQHLAVVSGAEVIAEYTPGVLQARTAGINKSSGNIIVSVNADTYYPPRWLDNLLYHFHDPGVVAVASVGLFKDRPLENTFIRVYRRVERRMYGFASAFRRSAYESTGGFNLSVDPVNAVAIEYEEQQAFKHRLLAYGRYILDAFPVYTSYRRHICDQCGSKSCPSWLSEYCEQIRAKRRF